MFIFVIFSGCSLTPVPQNIEQLHEETLRIIPLIEQKLQEGDIIFRLSQTQLLGGLVDFSKTIANATESDFSHAVLVYKISPDGIILADITPTGIARRYLIDWYIEGTSNFAVKRLKPEYQYYLPLIMCCVKQKIDEDILYDAKFAGNGVKFYCTEFVDHCFRQALCPLAPRLKIKDFPKFDLFFSLGCFIGGIDINSEVAIVGNNKIGLFSSEKLETVLDFRN